ncbi:MAG: hypothetical protein HY847_11025 [Betaproteobacteria bacterium]|nr:hypothetical protein [Betaproteobacteria bacterium]
MSTMLGLIGRATKRFKALNKQRWAVVWQTVANKPVGVLLAAAVISVPCLAETPAVDRAEVAPKLVSGGKMLGKDLDQSTVKRMPAKPGENGGVDSGAKGGGSFSTTNVAMNLKSTKDAHKSDGQADSPGSGDYLQAALLGLLAWIPLMSIFMKTPNVELTGGRSNG